VPALVANKQTQIDVTQKINVYKPTVGEKVKKLKVNQF
jgi:hypothetical protein